MLYKKHAVSRVIPQCITGLLQLCTQACVTLEMIMVNFCLISGFFISCMLAKGISVALCDLIRLASHRLVFVGLLAFHSGFQVLMHLPVHTRAVSGGVSLGQTSLFSPFHQCQRSAGPGPVWSRFNTQTFGESLLPLKMDV